MLHGCPSCPDVKVLKDYLKNMFLSNEVEELFYQQWASTDKCLMQTINSTTSEFIKLFVKSILKLKRHAFIAKTQSYFLKELKNDLSTNHALVLLDFAENYSFVVQDEAQSFHWNNMQCSIHPAVIYYIFDGQLTSKSMCIVSEDLEHDVSFVFEVQKAVVKWIKQNVSSVNKITYFSDGCAQQYKNYKNFMNLCCHFEDFAINATWIFFCHQSWKVVT